MMIMEHGNTPFTKANPNSIDWKQFIGNAPAIPFNAEHFSVGENGGLMDRACLEILCPMIMTA